MEISPEVMKKELEPEKEKPASSRSRCLRSSAPGQARKKKVTRKRRVRTQDMIEGGTYYSMGYQVQCKTCLELIS